MKTLASRRAGPSAQEWVALAGYDPHLRSLTPGILQIARSQFRCRRTPQSVHVLERMYEVSHRKRLMAIA